MTKKKLHPLIKGAAKGKLPKWAQVDRRRYAHMTRVADLLTEWADELGLPRKERRRWTALGYLHDALKCADPKALKKVVSGKFKKLPPATSRLWESPCRTVGCSPIPTWSDNPWSA